MGVIISRFRKKPSTIDVLTKLEDEITSIEEFQQRTKQTQRKIVFRFLILAIIIYAALAFLLYLYFSQISPNQWFLCSIPLIAFPLVIWFIKKFLTWYYNRKIKKNENKLVSLKEKKKKILENVMENETYKVAKQILDKFANEPKKPLVLPTPVVQRGTPMPTTAPDTALRQRYAATQNLLRGRASFGGAAETPVPPQRQLALQQSSNVLQQTPIRIQPVRSPPSIVTPILPRGILPKNRSILDKMVDFLVGDGPSNRYALICHSCSGHNGMALKEEFEYFSFRCVYCNTFNPARKKRPEGPKFDSPLMLTPARQPDESQSEDESSSSDSEPIVEEPPSDSPEPPMRSDSESESKMEVEESEPAKTAKVTESGDAAHPINQD
ncbi:endoplasmic reticulum junction formation protein lunapark [Anthonomus grandis grandis]|uniref:endoplasmic reticulum junction formation protein lunapark n=1 Tax=Anthonomus grandis grandis TaxID=2921223 RepID=UPI00216529DC|nr:endoplasmic reticulum junction formation protein lunapark [Anthonomus grandis grandis]